MQFLKRLFHGFKKRLTSKPVKIMLPILLILILAPMIVDAATPSAGETSTDVIRKMVVMLNQLLQFLQFLLYPLLMIIAALMDNELLIGPAMENKLRMIWVEIRNWVNMAFVLIMVGIAFYNVMGIAGDGSNYALKSILPKIVIGLVAVNFSFLAAKLMIDSTAVLTNAVYALPGSAKLVDWDDQRDEMKVRLCNKPGVDEAGKTTYEYDPSTRRNAADASLLGLIFCEKPEGGEVLSGEFNTFGKNFFNHFGQHNVSVALMVQMGNAADIPIPKEGGISVLPNITFSLLFGIFLFVMFGFAYAALAVVLIARVVVLWICLALSPVAVLLFIFPDLGNAAGSDLNIKEKFFGHLFVPLVIGVVFSIGFTMLATLKGSSAGGWLGQIGDKGLDDIETVDQVINLTATYGKDLSDFQDLLIAVAAVVIIWMGTFAAAEKTVANSITGAIKSAGQSTGKFIAKLPAYATAIPVRIGGKEDKISLANIAGVALGAPQEMERQSQRKTQDLLGNIFGDEGTRRQQQSIREIQNGSVPEGQHTLHTRFMERNLTNDDARALSVALAGKINPGLATTLNDKKEVPDIREWLKRNPTEAAQLLGPTYSTGDMMNKWGTQSTATSATEAEPGTTPATGALPATQAILQPTDAKGKPAPLTGTLTDEQAGKIQVEINNLVGKDATTVSEALKGVVDMPPDKQGQEAQYVQKFGQ